MTLRIWQLATVTLGLVAVLVLALGLAQAPRILVPGAEGVLGYAAEAAHVDGWAAHRVTGFEPESALPTAGVAVGDLIVDPPRESLVAGETVQLQVVRGDAMRRVEVRAVHIERLSTPLRNALDLVLNALALVLGVAILLRRWRDVGALALASVLLLSVGGLAPVSASDHRLAGLVVLWSSICSVLAMPLLAYFALAFDQGYRSPARPWLVAASALLALAGSAWAATLGPYFTGRVWIAPEQLLQPLRATLLGCGVLLAALSVMDAWRHSSLERRERMRWLLVALALSVVNFAMLAAFVFGPFGGPAGARVTVLVLSDVLAALTFGILTYTILRHRVVDVGFAINRAVVFAVFTAVLLVCFALVEWLVERFVEFEQREKNAWLDAFVAVGLYLALHRARHWIESSVERVFFRAWHDKETALLRFLEMSPHYSTSEALLDATLTAVDMFSDARGSGIYQRDEAGSFRLLKATLPGLPQAVGRDDSAVVHMRTFMKPVDPIDGRSALHEAALVLPMSRRSDLVGFLVMGPKRTQQSYRPDEIDNLVGTGRQVGFDLYALRLEVFERENEQLRHRGTVAG